MLLLVNLSWWVSFSPRIITLYHHHRCWLLYFVVFLCFLISHEYDYLMGFLITLEVLCWVIILLLLISIVSLPANLRRFTVTVVYFYILSYLFIFHPRISSTTRWGCWLHCKYFAERSHYHYISSLFFSHHNGIVFPSPLLIVIFWTFNVIPSHRWVRPLVGISGYILSPFLSDDNISIFLYIIITLIGWIVWYHSSKLLVFQQNGAI